MKDINLMIWLTQLGLSVALPLAGSVLLGLWLRSRFGWGNWVIGATFIVGVAAAAGGFWNSLRAMSRMAEKEEEQPDSSNDHD